MAASVAAAQADPEALRSSLTEAQSLSNEAYELHQRIFAGYSLAGPDDLLLLICADGAQDAAEYVQQNSVQSILFLSLLARIRDEEARVILKQEYRRSLAAGRAVAANNVGFYTNRAERCHNHRSVGPWLRQSQALNEKYIIFNQAQDHALSEF